MNGKIIILGARGSLEAAGSLMLFLAVKQMANLREDSMILKYNPLYSINVPSIAADSKWCVYSSVRKEQSHGWSNRRLLECSLFM